MKKFFNSFSFCIIVTIILVISTGFNAYKSWYKPNQKKYKTEYLENELARNGYNRKIAKPLLSEFTEDIHFIDITELMLKGDTVFTYYTTDNYKVTYKLEYISYKTFNTYDINTQMNVLTNIYRACSEHFQKEFQVQLDSLVQSNNIIFLSKDKIGKDRKISRELLDKEGVRTLWVNKHMFTNALAECVKRHINDDNNIVGVQKIDPDIFKIDEKWKSYGDLGQLGFLSIDNDIQWEKLSDKEIKDREMKNQALEVANEIAKDTVYQLRQNEAKEIRKYERQLFKMDFTIYGDFLFPGGSPLGLYLPYHYIKYC